jgi:hypothetical protein
MDMNEATDTFSDDWPPYSVSLLTGQVFGIQEMKLQAMTSTSVPTFL